MVPTFSLENENNMTDFKRTILMQNPYIDKTLIIKEFDKETESSNGSWLCRPRKWGKTYNLGTMFQFY